MAKPVIPTSVNSAGMSVFAAFAFAGAGEIMKLIVPNQARAELERHNKAMENLSRAKEAFYERQVHKREELAKRQRESAEARVTIQETNRSLDRLGKALALRQRSMQQQDREPVIGDFYKPSKNFVIASYVFMGVLGVSVGVGSYIIYRLVRKRK